jgi:outer membrane lipoprotein SlyB|tara:strand:- start:562 stop:798 length:237 start_codon:yes stop_codon:yes gene_type:complete
MQKLINVLAVSSAVVSLTVVGIGGYVYVRKDAIIESIKEKALGSLGGGALGGVTEMIPDMGSPESPAVPPVGLGVPSF